jgi:Ca-activated chloride channel family protein
MIPNDLNYHYPFAVYFIFGALFIFALFWRLFFYRKDLINLFASEKVINEILMPRSRYNFWAKVVSLCLVWIFATLALMEPRGNGHYPLSSGIDAGDKTKRDAKEGIVKRKAHEVIFLVDASASMEVADTRTGQTRLEFAKEIVDEVISRLKGESVALYAFTSDTTKLSPPTMDYLFVRLMLRNIKINEGDLAGTNVVEAIEDMRDDYFTAITPKLKTLIVLTDGGDTNLEGLKGAEREKHIQSILNHLDKAEENQLRVFTIGMGTEQGKTVPGVEYEGKQVVSSLDENLLERISEAGRGRYYFSNDWTALDLAQDLASKIGEEEALLEEYKVKTDASAAKGEEDLIYDLYYQIPLGIGMILLSLSIFFPDTRHRKKGL